MSTANEPTPTTAANTPETDAELLRIRESFEIFVIDEAPTLAVLARRLEQERNEAREQIVMMIEHDRQSLESDSVVASCDCLTKSPEVKYHKPGCKYRLISERDEARGQLKAIRRELAAANKGAERCSHINNSLAVSLHEVRETLRKSQRGCDELAGWKAEHMFIESQWDAQAVAKELGIPAGAPIRKNILPAVQAMRSAIKGTHDEMHEIMMAPWANLPGRANDMIEAVVNKLQPFLKR